MSELYLSCKIFQIQQIYEYQLGNFMHKIVHNLHPCHISQLFTLIANTHNYSTRIAVNKHLSTISASNSLTQRTVQYCGPRLWNNIPIDLKEKALPVFRKLYKKYIANKVKA